MNKEQQVEFNVKNIVCNCADLKKNDKVVIVTDFTTKDIGDRIEQVAKLLTTKIIHYTIKPFTMHGQEPPTDVAASMATADVIFGLTAKSMAHTGARLTASNNGARYLSLADYNEKVISSLALAVDFKELSSISTPLADKLSQAAVILVQTKLGTDITLKISGRKGNNAPGWCFQPGSIASPPDAEVNIAPIEDQSNGIIVVDGSIPCDEIGLLERPITLIVEHGKVRKIEGDKSEILENLFNSLNTDLTRVIAEFGIGLNPKAILSGNMLEDEGCKGTVHFGIGSNATIGGVNKVPFHLDHIIRDATVYFDDQCVIKDGKFL